MKHILFDNLGHNSSIGLVQVTIFKLTVDGKTDIISAIVLKKKRWGMQVTESGSTISIAFNMLLNIVDESQQSESVCPVKLVKQVAQITTNGISLITSLQ